MAAPIKMQATVAEIIQYSGDIYQVVFTPEKKIPKFKSGQFLHLALDEYDSYTGLWPESRAFSIASSNKSSQITIVYSVKGSFTGRMKNELCVGKTVWLKFPYGSFVINAYDHTQDVVLVAGGTGIAPYIPYLEEELVQPTGRRIVLVYGIRGDHCFLFEELVKTRCQWLPKFELVLFNAQAIDFSVVINKAEALHDPHYFISGPQGMITSLRSFLASECVSQDRVHVDDWD